MRIDIGIASYENPDKLDATLKAIVKHSRTDWRCFIIDNNSPDPQVKEVIDRHVSQDNRFIAVYSEDNKGYAGAVNKLFELAETDYIAYCDNDATPKTEGWDLGLANILDTNSEVAMAFPVGHGTGSAYPIQRKGYKEILWGVGCSWLLRREAQEVVGLFDEELGHQEEVDYQIRLRMAGWHMAKAEHIEVYHNATASNSPEAQERIGKGVYNWVNKWCKYFTGELVDYNSPNVLRFEDWPPTALYLEEFYQKELPGLNDDPEQVVIEGRTYDLLRLPRACFGSKGSVYRGRII